MLVLLTILLEIRQISLFSFPAAVRIELDPQRGCQHFGCEVFGIVARNAFFFSEGMVLGKIAVRVAVGRNSDTD